MSDRINLTKIRFADIAPHEVTALVEAVEAAHQIAAAYVDEGNKRAWVPAMELNAALARFSFGDNTYTPDDHASRQAARRYENHLEQMKDHGP